MATPTGTISMSDISLELGKASSHPTSLNDSVVRTLAGKGVNDSVSFNDLRGKSYSITYEYAPFTSWGILRAPTVPDQKYNFSETMMLFNDNAQGTSDSRPVPTNYADSGIVLEQLSFNGMNYGDTNNQSISIILFGTGIEADPSVLANRVPKEVWLDGVRVDQGGTWGPVDTGTNTISILYSIGAGKGATPLHNKVHGLLEAYSSVTNPPNTIKCQLII